MISICPANASHILAPFNSRRRMFKRSIAALTLTVFMLMLVTLSVNNVAIANVSHAQTRAAQQQRRSVGASSLTGTTWSGLDGAGKVSFMFLGGNKVRAKFENSPTWTTGTWRQNGKTVTLYIAELSTWEGTITGSTLQGDASNIVGEKWRWSVTRSGAANRADMIAPSIANSTWEGTWNYYESAPEQCRIEFRADGNLVFTHKDGTSELGTWQQAGTTVRFAVGKGIDREFQQVAEGTFFDGKLEGRGYTARGGKWTWSLTRSGNAKS